MSSVESDLQTHLARFGLTSFRPGQREVIEAVLAGEDCVCIMPTGGGKSLCYQLPAIARNGLTLVISPLIALMKDQVDGLDQLGISATFLNSSLTLDEQHERLDGIRAGQYDLVYVAPERLRSPRFVDALSATSLQLLAIDEAHCISQWGHDFRPDYSRIGRYRQKLGSPQTIALTATATERVREDVVEQLGLREPRAFLAGFSRPNLHFEVRHAPSVREKADWVKRVLNEEQGAGIIYVSARKRCDEVAELVASCGRSVGVYHGGMQAEERRRAQDDFIQGRTEVVVATVAFGMGIDKSNVRFVLHYNLPGSIEGYYQEAGRAGRDGLPSRCVLLHTPSDRFIQEFFIENSYPSPDTVSTVHSFLTSLDDDPIQWTYHDIKQQLGLEVGPEGIGVAIGLLEKAGVLERMEPHRNMAVVCLKSDLPTLLDLLPRQASVQREVLREIEKLVGEQRWENVYFSPRQLAERTDRDLNSLNRTLRELRKLEAFDYVPAFRGRALHILDAETYFSDLGIDFVELAKRKAAEYDKLDQMLAYAQAPGCRQLEMLAYFGDHSGQPCGTCDNCQRTDGNPDSQVQLEPSEQLDRVISIALSGVTRAKGRFGKQVVAQMLWGSSSAKISRWKLDQLSTFGLLNGYKLNDVVELLDWMIATGLVEQVEADRFRPVIRITEKGISVMKQQAHWHTTSVPLPPGLASMVLPAPRTSPKSRPPADTGNEVPANDVQAGQDEAKIESTNTTGATNGSSTTPGNLSSETADVPILDTDLSFSPAASPLNSREPAAEGFDLPEYPSEIIEEPPGSNSPATEDSATREIPHSDELPYPVSETPHFKSRSDESPSHPEPTHNWTWRLLMAGLDADECAACRRLSVPTILQHALRAVGGGKPVQNPTAAHAVPAVPSLRIGIQVARRFTTR